MGKILLIAGATIGGLIVVAAALIIYGALNLNSIVKRDRRYVLDKLSDTVGRDVQAQDIQVGLGWGVTLEISGLEIADDPSFSQLPFLKARQVSGQVELLPLLSGQVLITRLAMLNPEVRILRDSAGRLNVSTLGAHQGATTTTPGKPARQHAGGAPISFLVRDLNLKEGEVSYQDAAAKGHPIEAGHVNLDVSDVNPTRPFPIKLGLAVTGGAQNLSVKGTAGPLLRDGKLEVMDTPLSFTITAGPMLLDRLRNFPELRSRIPSKLSMPDPVTVHAKIKGTPSALAFDVNTDLGAERLVYLGLFHKPAGTPFQISASGSQRLATLAISQAKIKLADFQARLTDLRLGNGSFSAKVDTNRFNLAPLAKMAAALAKYELSGSSEAHLVVASAAPVPRASGSIALAGVGFKVEGSTLPGVTGLTGTIRLDGNSATLEPANFALGSSHASLQGQATSLRPLRATYSLRADNFKLAEVMPERPPDEQLSQIAASGTVAARPDGMALTTALTSGQGMVSNVPYRNLNLRAGYDGRQADISALTLDAYGGLIAVKGDAAMAAPRPFRATVNLTNVDLQQALAAQKAKAAGMIRGVVSGQINAAGKAADLNEVTVNAALTSPQGMVSDLAFRNLALRADYDGRRANVSSLTLNAYGGSIAARGVAVVAAPRPFQAAVNLTNIDLQQALTGLKAKAANTLRGALTGQIIAAGSGENFEQIKTTLRGNGRIQIDNGKLIGVNVAASALKQISGIPVINTLITPSIVARHPALFSSPDTDLKVARLSYVMTGPRMTSNDITVVSDDYRMLASGWFDLDRNVDLSIHLLMSRQFSGDLQAEKKNVVYLENPSGEIEIPLLVRGAMPHPSVQPDVQFLVQRAATQAVQQQGTQLLNKYLGGNKGIGKYLGGAGSGGAPSGNNPPNNPIAPLENLFH